MDKAEGSQDHPGLEILEVEEDSPVTTPISSLTIGNVLDLISKFKNGSTIYCLYTAHKSTFSYDT